MKKLIINVIWFIFAIIVVTVVTGLLYVTPLVFKIATLCDRNPAILRSCTNK